MFDKAQLRGSLFRHLDGIVSAPTAYALHSHQVTDYILREKNIFIDKISTEFNANDGYLNIALRICSSQGWLDQVHNKDSDQISYSINDKSKIAFDHFYLYKDAVELLKISEKYDDRKFELKPFLLLEKIFFKLKEKYNLSDSGDTAIEEIKEQIFSHIEGIILGPTTVHLGMSGMFHKYFMEASFKPEEFHGDADSFERLLDIFYHYKWFTKKKNTYQFTEKGLFFAKRASAYGVTVSYIPTLRKLDDLIFGDPMILKMIKPGQPEIHVDREMNVWGSGGAHSGYFKVVDKIIIDIFNRPIEDQPKGILDMGCGNGAFLQHLFQVISLHTSRGQMLEEYPLILIGADYNEAALKITRANLIQSDIWAKVVHGDIGRPDLLAHDLKESYGINLQDLLNVRSFLDHNRIWSAPKIGDKKRTSSSSGAFAHNGNKLDNYAVEESLLEHFTKWSPYVRKHGLLIIELHTVKPELVAQNLGRTAATAYDATHGYSDQYILELDVFLNVVKEAGLIPKTNQSYRFPDSGIATVSINLLKTD